MICLKNLHWKDCIPWMLEVTPTFSLLTSFLNLFNGISFLFIQVCRSTNLSTISERVLGSMIISLNLISKFICDVCV